MYIVKLSSGVLWKRHIDQMVATDIVGLGLDVNNRSSSESEQLIVEPSVERSSQSAYTPTLTVHSPNSPVHSRSRACDVTPCQTRQSLSSYPSPTSTIPIPADQVNKDLSPAVVRRSQRAQKQVERLNFMNIYYFISCRRCFLTILSFMMVKKWLCCFGI